MSKQAPLFSTLANRFASFAGFTIDLYGVIAVSPVVHEGIDTFKVYTDNRSYFIEAEDGKAVRGQFIAAWRASIAHQVNMVSAQEFLTNQLESA